MEKDKKEIENHKLKVIDDLKKINKKEMFQEKPKNKISIFNKLLMIFGYGKKG